MDQSDLYLLVAFVDSEEAALAEERQGNIYPGYHFQLGALAPKAGGAGAMDFAPTRAR